jgi:hypothetical protein
MGNSQSSIRNESPIPRFLVTSCGPGYGVGKTKGGGKEEVPLT